MTTSASAAASGLGAAAAKEVSCAVDELYALASKHLSTLPPTTTADAAILLLFDDSDKALLLDLRAVPLSVRMITAHSATIADVVIRTNTDTVQDVLNGKLSIVRAYARSQIKIEKGDLAMLRRLGTNLAAAHSAAAASAIAATVQVRVKSARVETAGRAHGVYSLLVSEGAASWAVERRWSELQAVHTELVAGYGPTSPCGFALPLRPRTRDDYLGRSTSNRVLTTRSAMIEAWCEKVLRVIPCSPMAGHGAKPLLAFLGADELSAHARGPMAGPMGTSMGTSTAACAAATIDFGSALPFAHLVQQRQADAKAEAVAALAAHTRRIHTFAGSCAAAVLAVACVGTALPSWLLGALIGTLISWAVLLTVPIGALLSRASLLARYSRVTLLFARVVVWYKYTSFVRCRRGRASEVTRQREWSAFHDWLGGLLFREISVLGGLWLKIGQYIASRSDMIPDEIIAHLSKMLDCNPPRPLSETLDTLISAWGEMASTHLDVLEPHALSCGSIAQVHIGWLHRPGMAPLKVAVKVQHRDIAPVLTQDLRQCDVLSIVLAWLEPTFDFRPILREVNGEHAKELDFTLEAANLTDVRTNLARSCTFTPVIVPAVVDALTSERVLIMEFCEGAGLKDGEMLRERGIDTEQLLLRVCEVWAAQMFSDGVFNADAHAGNILVRHDADHGAVPILLDFGLTKRLTPAEHIAFCKMVHALEEVDGDVLIEALVELGFRMVADEIEPSEVFRDLAFSFRDSSGDAAAARQEFQQKMDDDMKRGDVYMKDARQHVKSGKKAPLEAVPGVVVFFMKSIDMIQGLATRLGVQDVKLLAPMTTRARQTLLAHATASAHQHAPQLRSSSANDYQANGWRPVGRLAPPVASPAHERVLWLMHALVDTGQMLGGQCCVYLHGERVVDAAAGRMGPVDPRPVEPASLFQLFQAGCPLLATLVLRLCEQRRIALDAPVAAHWPAFGKAHITVADVLRHAGGLEQLMPARAHLKQLLDCQAMEAHIAQAPLKPTTAPAGDFGGATYGWTVSGMLRAVAPATGDEAGGMDDLLIRHILSPLNLTRELMMRCDQDDADAAARLVRHSTAELMKEMGLSLSDLTSSSSPSPDAAGPSATPPAALSPEDGSADPFAATSNEVDWERFQGPQQLQMPGTFNSKRLVHAGLPGGAMLGSARALAQYYDALGRAEIISAASLRHAMASPTSGTLEEEPVEWALGWQLGWMHRAAYRASQSDLVAARPKKVRVLGHRGTGGTVAFCAPDAGLAIAITVSQLSTTKRSTRRLLTVALEECGGWAAPSGGLV